MRLINLIHISPSLSIHKMRPLRAYQSSDDKLIHHDFIWSVHIHTTTQFFPMMMTLSYMHQQSVVIRDKLWVCNKNRLLNDTMLLLLRCFWLRYLYFFFTLTRGSDNEMRCNQKGAEEIKLFFNFKFMVWGWLGNNYMCASIASFFCCSMHDQSVSKEISLKIIIHYTRRRPHEEEVTLPQHYFTYKSRSLKKFHP